MHVITLTTLQIEIHTGAGSTVILNLHSISDVFWVLGLSLSFSVHETDIMSQRLEAGSALNYVCFWGESPKSSFSSQKDLSPQQAKVTAQGRCYFLNVNS